MGLRRTRMRRSQQLASHNMHEHMLSIRRRPCQPFKCKVKIQLSYSQQTRAKLIEQAEEVKADVDLGVKLQ